MILLLLLLLLLLLSLLLLFHGKPFFAVAVAAISPCLKCYVRACIPVRFAVAVAAIADALLLPHTVKPFIPLGSTGRLNGSHDDISACITKLSCKDFGTSKLKFVFTQQNIGVVIRRRVNMLSVSI